MTGLEYRARDVNITIRFCISADELKRLYIQWQIVETFCISLGRRGKSNFLFEAWLINRVPPLLLFVPFVMLSAYFQDVYQITDKGRCCKRAITQLQNTLITVTYFLVL